MESQEIMYTLVYMLVSACVVCPPTEFINAGITVQGLFASLLGSEQMDFVFYHMRRTVVTMLVHSCLPIGYYIGLTVFNSNLHYNFVQPSTLPAVWQIYLSASLLVLLTVTVLSVYRTSNGWSRHPLAYRLQLLAPSGTTWRAVASTINVEFRRFDKFAAGSTPGRRVIVTDSWLINTWTYGVDVARQCDAHLAVVGSDEHTVAPDSITGAQYLNIDVAGVNIKPFRIRLNASEYGDLKDKLRSPIMNIRNIIIHQTLSERFLEAFRYHVNENEPYRLPVNVSVELCIGCMQAAASVKLERRCADVTDTMALCQVCRCRPMWCIDCMGRWFASRQDQSQPDSWLSCRCPCPTCRAPFCMLDVCRII